VRRATPPIISLMPLRSSSVGIHHHAALSDARALEVQTVVRRYRRHRRYLHEPAPGLAARLGAALRRLRAAVR